MSTAQTSGVEVREKNVNFYQLEQTVSTREVKGVSESSSFKLPEIPRAPFTRFFPFSYKKDGLHEAARP